MENQRGVSFRGQEIPIITKKVDYEVLGSQEIVDKITQMSPEESDKVTVEAIHYSSRGISEVKLTTGDIVSIETAIALADSRLLSGYTTGSTAYGGKTLRSMPNLRKDGTWNSIHNLPHF